MNSRAAQWGRATRPVGVVLAALLTFLMFTSADRTSAEDGSDQSPPRVATTQALFGESSQTIGTFATGTMQPPTNLTVKRTPDTRDYVLTWTASTTTYTSGYTIERAAATAGPYSAIGTVTGRTTTTFTDSTASLNDTSYYRVHATYQNWVSGAGGSSPYTPPAGLNISDNFNRIGAALGTTSSGNAQWVPIRGSAWSTNGSVPQTSTAPSSSPAAVVNTEARNGTVSVNTAAGGGDDALVFRATTTTNDPSSVSFLRARTQRSSVTTSYYYCPNGGSLSGSTCYVTTTYAASYQEGEYYCPDGGTLSGTTCTKTETYAASSTTTYSCNPGDEWLMYPDTCRAYGTATPGGGCDPSYYTRVGADTCIYDYPSNKTTTYSCPNGGTLDGTTCYVTTTYTASQYDGYYYCPNGGTLSGTTCYVTTTYEASIGYTTTYTSRVALESVSAGGAVSGLANTVAYSGTDPYVGISRVQAVLNGTSVQVYTNLSSSALISVTTSINQYSTNHGIGRAAGSSFTGTGLDNFAFVPAPA
jgi:hypothetical protein